MFSIPIIHDGLNIRRLQPGDVLAQFEPALPATDTTVTLAYTAAMLLNNPVYVRNPAGVSTDTFPDASQLVAALNAILGVSFVPNGLTFRWRVINLSANLLTGAVTANTGATMVRGNVPASTTKDFQVLVTNGTPAYTASNITSANGSATLSGFSKNDIKNISVGMVVQNNVVGTQGQTVTGVNAAAFTVTLSGSANAAGPSSFTFYPQYTITGLAA